MSDKMDDLPLALDTAVDRHHTRRKDHPALPFIEFCTFVRQLVNSTAMEKR